jgi:hypothetical protein
MELSKSDNRIARILIQKGLMNEFAKGLKQADNILTDWKEGKGDARESYHALYKHITGFDKGIASRYDATRNSELLDIILQQLKEKLIEVQDLTVLSAEGQATINQILSWRSK